MEVHEGEKVKVGLISDTHGDRHAAVAAARLFTAEEVVAVFHCGDIGGMEVLADMAAVLHGKGVPIHAVLGNMDFYDEDWRFFPSGIGVELHGRFGEAEIEGKRIALLHGDESARLRDALRSEKYDFVFCGHTHRRSCRREGRTLCVNPGAAGRGHPKSCAVVELGTEEVRFFDL